MTKKLKGLDTLRAIAALIVVIGHIELLKIEKGITISNFFVFPDGHLSVILFFVLSGFLLTFLLANEKRNAGSIDLKKFYMRRILRIWPLYFTIIILSFLLFPTNFSSATFALCLSIFPNVAHALDIGWSISPQIWSIGVEEQFYLIWPITLIFIPAKRLKLVLILFFIGYSCVPNFVNLLISKELISFRVGDVLNSFFNGSKFNCLALGAFFGFALSKEEKWIMYFENYFLAIFIISFTAILWFFHFELSHFNDEFFALLFGLSILCLVKAETISIDSKIAGFLGKISYGIYMYHWIVILLAIKFIPKKLDFTTYNFLLYTVVLVVTIFISWLSSITVERYFIQKKKFYAN